MQFTKQLTWKPSDFVQRCTDHADLKSDDPSDLSDFIYVRDVLELLVYVDNLECEMSRHDSFCDLLSTQLAGVPTCPDARYAFLKRVDRLFASFRKARDPFVRKGKLKGCTDDDVKELRVLLNETFAAVQTGKVSFHDIDTHLHDMHSWLLQRKQVQRGNLAQSRPSDRK